MQRCGGLENVFSDFCALLVALFSLRRRLIGQGGAQCFVSICVTGLAALFFRLFQRKNTLVAFLRVSPVPSWPKPFLS